MRKPIGFAALSVLLLLAACAAPGGTTLYERLGGRPVVKVFVDRTLDRTSTDSRTKRSFEGIRIAAIKESLAEQICVVSDGSDCKYEGETMHNAHAQSNIQPREFDAMVEILREELDRAGVAPGAKNELLKRLAPMKRDIVATTTSSASR